MHVPFDLERPNSAGKQRWGGAYRGSATPLPQGVAPQFWGFLLFMHAPFDAELPMYVYFTFTKFDVETHGEGLVFRGQSCPIPRGQGPSAPKF